MPASSPRLYGAHVSASGGFVNAIRNGVELGCTAIQIHSSPPQRWNHNPYPKGYEDDFLKERKSSGIEKIFFHGIYLINLASPDDKLRGLSIKSLIHYLDLMERINGDGVIFHVGSLKDEPSESVGYKRAAKCIDEVIAAVPGTARLVLEVAAGSGSIIGDRMEELAEIYGYVKKQDRVCFALDTQHLWASGYDLKTKLDEVMKSAEKVLGLKKIVAVHVNDSLTELASRRDRHANLGEGLIGKEALQAFMNHPKMKNIPMILETPALKTMETAKEELKVLKKMLFV